MSTCCIIKPYRQNVPRKETSYFFYIFTGGGFLNKTEFKVVAEYHYSCAPEEKDKYLDDFLKLITKWKIETAYKIVLRKRMKEKQEVV